MLKVPTIVMRKPLTMLELVGEEAEVTLEDLAEVAKEVPEVVYLPFGCLQPIIILI
jgi:hypothetical protein